MTLEIRPSRRARLRNLPSYLAVAPAAAVGELRLALSLLPVCARGQVVIEVAEGEVVEAIQVPARIGVTLVRLRNGQLPGEAARARVHAWASEMVCGDAQHSVWLAGDDAFTGSVRDMLRDQHDLPVSAFADVTA